MLATTLILYTYTHTHTHVATRPFSSQQDVTQPVRARQRERDSLLQSTTREK